MKESFLDSIKAMTLGLAVGDALGVPYEFLSRNVLNSAPPSGMRGYGTHNQPPGTWSDDTSLTLCLMKSLVGGLDYDDIARRFEAWLTTGYMTAGGRTFDVGIATRKAIQNYQDGNEATICGEMDEYSNGNGSLMRVSPLAPLLRNLEILDRRTIIFKVSAITHGHSRSKIACWFYVEILINILKGSNKFEAIDESWQLVGNWLDKQGSEELKHFGRCNSQITNIPTEEIKSSGYVIDTLEAAIWAFLKSESYEDCVLSAVGLGDDTDTVGAIAGSIAGLYYGLSSIPKGWLHELKKRKEIEDICSEFHAKIENDSRPTLIST